MASLSNSRRNIPVPMPMRDINGLKLNLTRASQNAHSLEEQENDKLSSLFLEKGKHEQKLKYEENKLGKLSTELRALERNSQNCNKEITLLRNDLEKNEAKVKEAQDELESSEANQLTTAITGIILTGTGIFAPIGIPLIVISLTVLQEAVENASRDRDKSNENLCNTMFRENEIEQELQNIQVKRADTKQTKIQIRRSITKIEGQIQEVQQNIQLSGQVNKLLKTWISNVDTAVGKIDIISEHAQVFGHIHPVLQIFAELQEQLSNVGIGYNTLFGEVGFDMQQFRLDLVKVYEALENVESHLQVALQYNTLNQDDDDQIALSIPPNHSTVEGSNFSVSICDVSETWLYLNQEHTGWQKLVVNMPKRMSELCSVMLAAACERDFKLDTRTPLGGFKYLKYTGSYRASLLQVANYTWKSFNLANTHMESIQSRSDLLCHYVQKVIDTVLNGTDGDISDLPKMINFIQTTTVKIRDLADEVDESFMATMKLVGELVEVGVNRQSFNEKSVHALAKEREELESQKDTSLQNISQLETDKSYYREQMSSVEDLAYYQRSSNSNFDRIQAENIILSEKWNKLANNTKDTSDLKDAVHVLITSRKCFAEMCEGWSEMAQFFDKIGSLIICLLMDIPSRINVSRFGKNVRFSPYKRNKCHDEAARLSSASRLVHLVSNSYCNASKKHVMPVLSGLHSLISEDHESRSQQVLQEYSVRYETAQRELSLMISENEKTYGQQIQQTRCQQVECKRDTHK